jgi:hypothetical protein
MGSDSILLDVITIGVWHMDSYSRGFSNWRNKMESDDELKRLCDQLVDEHGPEYLSKLFNWSNAALVGCYVYKAGALTFDEWRESFFQKLDVQTQREITPFIQGIFKCVKELSGSIGQQFRHPPFRPSGLPYNASKYTLKQDVVGVDHYHVCADIIEARTLAKHLSGATNDEELIKKISIFHDCCPRCGEPLKLRLAPGNRFFWICSDYPRDAFSRGLSAKEEILST